MENRKVKQVLSKGWYQQEGAGYMEMAQEGEYGGNFMYSCVNMVTGDLLKLLQEWGERK
jgi:hypothetical protein